MPLRSSKTVVPAAVIFVLCCVLPFGATAQGVENGKPAPDFQLTDLGGKVRKLSDLRGSVVLLNFWATWCPECLTEVDSLSAFTEKYQNKGVAVLAVSVDKNEASLADFMKKHPVSFPVMIDRDGEVFVRKYSIHGLPATIVIDRQGIVAARMLGAQEFLSQDFRAKIDGLLAK